MNFTDCFTDYRRAAARPYFPTILKHRPRRGSADKARQSAIAYAAALEVLG